MTPDQIAEDQALDIVAVKAGLMQCSSLYRKDCGKEDEAKSTLNFSDEQEERALKGIFDIGMTSEEDATRLKALIFIRNDKQGRLEKPKQLAGNTFNILNINEALQAARTGAARIKDSFNGHTNGKVIEA